MTDDATIPQSASDRTLPMLVAELQAGQPCPVCLQPVPGMTLGDLRAGAEPPPKVEHNASCAAYRPAHRCPACMRTAIHEVEEALADKKTYAEQMDALAEQRLTEIRRLEEVVKQQAGTINEIAHNSAQILAQLHATERLVGDLTKVKP